MTRVNSNHFHRAIIDLETGHARLRCEAPLHSMCHAVFDCQCEEYHDYGLDGRRPYHLSIDDDGEDITHWGSFDQDQCNLTDWFDNDDEPLNGEISVMVQETWECDYYSWSAVPGTAQVVDS